MTQRAVPVSDDSVNGWAPTPVYSQINELDPLDDKWVSTSGGTFQVKLAALAKPAPGPQEVRMHLLQAGGGGAPVKVTLLQGGSTPVATRTYSPGTSFAELSPRFILTDAEKALITDYTDLHLLVSVLSSSSSSSSAVVTGCCGGLPTVLHCSVSSTQFCTCSGWGTWVLLWDPVNNWWRGTSAVSSGPGGCGWALTVTLHCVGSGCAFQADLDTGNCGSDIVGENAVTCTCDPLSITFSVAIGPGFQANACGCQNSLHVIPKVTVTITK
jgi:hypothetical protein